MASQWLAVETDARISDLILEPAQQLSVLVVDDDRSGMAHCTQILEDLGYSYHTAACGREALDALGRHEAIQIIIANVRLPLLSGIALAEEARLRMGSGKVIAVILVGEDITTDIAIKGIRVEAVDMLAKPCSFDDYALALRRANRYLEARQPAPAPANDTSQGDIARLLGLLESRNAPVSQIEEASGDQLAGTLGRIISSRRLRLRHFPGALFADPAWDILLDLTRARFEGQEVSVSSVCIAASVPMSTALRWVRQMTDEGMLVRWTDPRDRRRDLIALSDTTAEAMNRYLTSVNEILRKA